jgi:transcriptional regulator
MYDFSYFKAEDQQDILQFIKEHPFAFLTGSFNDGSQVATQVPFLFLERNGELFLQAHIMRNTDHHKAFIDNPNALVVFTGPNCYVSGTWYKGTHIASTWNYMSVHMKGTVRWMSDEELITLMKQLTLHFEKNDHSSATIYDNLPPEFLRQMLPAIVGFEIKVERTENVFKLSQNRDAESYDNIVSELEKIGGESALVATEMKKRRAKLFPPGSKWDAGKFSS